MGPTEEVTGEGKLLLFPATADAGPLLFPAHLPLGHPFSRAPIFVAGVYFRSKEACNSAAQRKHECLRHPRF